MRILLLIFGISFFCLEGICQTVDFEFFQTSKRKNGKQYAKALIPARIDSVASYKKYNYPIYELQEVVRVDTVFFSGFMVLDKADNFEKIAHLADTTQQLFQLAEPTTFLHLEGCNHNYEWITEGFEKVEGFKTWTLISDEHQLSSKDWKIQPAPSYFFRKSLVVKMPCNTRESTAPIPYATLIRIIPKRTLTSKELALIGQYTKDYVTYNKTYHSHVERIPKTTVKEEFKYSLNRSAGIEEVEVYSEKEIKQLLPQITSKLMTLYLLSKLEGSDLKSIQKALLTFQHKHSFPIGQYERESIDWLLDL